VTRDAWDKNGDLFGGESLLSGKVCNVANRVSGVFGMRIMYFSCTHNAHVSETQMTQCAAVRARKDAPGIWTGGERLVIIR
jgi:hypothetical protein